MKKKDYSGQGFGVWALLFCNLIGKNCKTKWEISFEVSCLQFQLSFVRYATTALGADGWKQHEPAAQRSACCQLHFVL